MHQVIALLPCGLCGFEFRRRTQRASHMRRRHAGTDDATRFWLLVDRTAGDGACWPFTGYTDRRGYGKAHSEGRTIRAHRLAYMLGSGRSLSASDHLRHSCDNPPCCNPAHLAVGTHDENMADMVARGRSARGVRNGTAVLSEADVRAIRGLRGQMTQRAIAALFGVAQSTVFQAQTGARWSHVE